MASPADSGEKTVILDDTLDDRAGDSDAAMMEFLDALLARARQGGADAADALMITRRSLAIGYRLGKRETIERAEARDIGVRVFVGRRQAIASTADLAERSLAHVVEQAIAMAQASPEDPYCGLAGPGELAPTSVDVDGVDPHEPSLAEMAERAQSAEAAALAVSGVVNSEGAECAWEAETLALAATNGLAEVFRRSRHSLSVSVVAGNDLGMERDYDYATSVYAADLPDPVRLGTSAGENAARRLGPRKIDTGRFPVIYAPRAARSLLGHVAAAIAGPAVARKTSFLADRLGERIFPAEISIVDDPLRRRGVRSRPVDAEGLAASPIRFIDQGVLTGWLLDLSSARQLGLNSTARASRGIASPPSPAATNLFIEAGRIGADRLIGEVAAGLYITELIGMGVNMVTGDYSRGASGFWIRDGQLAFPVSEVTVSGHLLDMFAAITAANDLEYRYGIDSPTLRVDGMTVAGR